MRRDASGCVGTRRETTGCRLCRARAQVRAIARRDSADSTQHEVAGRCVQVYARDGGMIRQWRGERPPTRLTHTSTLASFSRVLRLLQRGTLQKDCG